MSIRTASFLGVGAGVLVLVGVGVALAAPPAGYTPPCTANTDSCRQQRIVALENHYKTHSHPTPTPTPTPTPSPSPSPSLSPSPSPSPTPTAAGFPDASNTGPTGTLTTYTGPCTITAANTVIDSKLINCDIQSNAAGLVVKNSQLNGQISGAGYRVEDSLIDGGNPYACISCGADGTNFTILRTEIRDTNRGAYCENTCLIQDSWIHGTTLEPVASNAAHASGIRVEQNATLIHNTIACDFNGPFVNPEMGCSADLTGYPDFAPIHHNTIDGNLFVANTGQGICAYGGGTAGKPFSNSPQNATYIVFKNNVFQRGTNNKCGEYGHVTSFIEGRTGNVWENNKWDDGTVAPPEE